MRIFCSGIGGIGLSAYAAHMHARGHQVSGSDRSDSGLIGDLRQQGIGETIAHNRSALPEKLDLLVYSEAIPADSHERSAAANRGVRQLSYFAALGELTKGTQLIAVCGTHGKSSTTAMVARLLIEAGSDPNVVVGTKLKELGGRNWRKSERNLWVVEACEYRRSFLYLSPRTILITNADGDHFDSFQDQREYERAFIDFFAKLPAEQAIIGHARDAQVMALVHASGKRFIDADSQPMIHMDTPGEHMQHNAQLALELGKRLGIEARKAQTILSGYAGTWRRMERKGKTAQGATVIDDYGHHPVEIAATLKALRGAYPRQNVVCVFQPHTHHRSLALWHAFGKSFSDADRVLVTDIYDARPDTESQTADPAKLAQKIADGSKVQARYSGDLMETERLLRQELKSADLLVCMGAGTITNLASRLAEKQ